MKGIRMIEGMAGGWEEFLDVNEGNNNGITTRESGVDEYGRVDFCFDSWGEESHKKGVLLWALDLGWHLQQ